MSMSHLFWWNIKIATFAIFDISQCNVEKIIKEFTLMILEPSSLYLMRFPTISAGWTISSSMASWTAVRVRERGLWAAEPFFGGLTILLVAMKTTSCHYMSPCTISINNNSLNWRQVFPSIKFTLFISWTKSSCILLRKHQPWCIKNTDMQSRRKN